MMRNPNASPNRPSEAADSLTALVAWFSTAKGFGFLKPVDGGDDVFVHISVVQRAGLESLPDGATVTCEVAPGKKGRQVTRLVNIDESTAIGDAGQGAVGQRAPRYEPRPDSGANRPYEQSRNGGSSRGAAPVDGPTADGVVKWFNATKGFGFITPDTGGKDVFLHASVIRRAGLIDVQPGQRVRYTAIDRDKGPEARSLEVAASDASVY